MPDLNEIKTKEKIKEMFCLFDLNGSGSIETKDIGTLIRALWKCPSETDLVEYKKEVDPNGSGRVSFENFCSLFERIPSIDKQKTKEELLSSFRVFDKNQNGLIQEKELKHLLINLGEKMTENEVNEFLKEANTDKEGWIEYSKLVEKMLDI